MKIQRSIVKKTIDRINLSIGISIGGMAFQLAVWLFSGVFAEWLGHDWVYFLWFVLFTAILAGQFAVYFAVFLKNPDSKISVKIIHAIIGALLIFLPYIYLRDIWFFGNILYILKN